MNFALAIFTDSLIDTPANKHLYAEQGVPEL